MNIRDKALENAKICKAHGWPLAAEGWEAMIRETGEKCPKCGKDQHAQTTTICVCGYDQLNTGQAPKQDDEAMEVYRKWIQNEPRVSPPYFLYHDAFTLGLDHARKSDESLREAVDILRYFYAFVPDSFHKERPLLITKVEAFLNEQEDK